MSEKQITIRMPAEKLEKWLAALRSGEYKQGYERLQTPHGYCCLGVLQVCLEGRVETNSHDCPCAAPTPEFLARHGITFLDSVDNSDCANPFVPALGISIAEANDGCESKEVRSHSFDEIADLIEACAEPT